MENLTLIKPRQLTEIEWDALRAALSCDWGGLPLVPGLLDQLREMKLTYYELFVLKPVSTHDVSSTYYVLLGWQDDDDIIANLPFPWIFGIYADAKYRYHGSLPGYDPLPSFDELYRTGLETLHRENRRSIRKGALQMALIFLYVGVLLSVVIEAAMHINGFIPLGIAVLASILGGLLGGLLNRRKIPKPEAAPTTA